MCSSDLLDAATHSSWIPDPQICAIYDCFAAHLFARVNQANRMQLGRQMALRSYRGDDIIQAIPIQIPANAHGTLALTVSDGARLNQTEQREARLPQPRTVPLLVRALNRARRNNTLYVKLLASDNGAVVGGEVLPSLPPSVLAVIESDRSSGNVTPLQTATLGEWQLRTEQAVSGVRSLTLQVSAN